MIADITLQHSLPGDMTELSLALNDAMSSSSSAREAYARIYGEQWSPLGDTSERSYAASTTCNTVR
jgi:hypothetical protein